MRIAFFDSESDELTGQRKGHLFEAFTKRLVGIAGYRDVELRVKRSSLEYDIEALSKLHGRHLFGEAKAHEASMPGKEASAFVGKLLPLAAEHGGIDGLFISASPFTPEASDYLASLNSGVLSTAKIDLRTLVGDEIPQFLAQNGICIAEAILRDAAKSVVGLEPCDAWLVVAARGDVFVVSFSQTVLANPTHFASFSLDGSPLTLDPESVGRLSAQIPDLAELDYFSIDSSEPLNEPSTISQRVELPEVVAGSGWFDYKFPSPPECFIGRADSLEGIVRFVGDVKTNATSVRAMQILSRSGVGKSSLLLKIAASDAANFAVTVDGRNLRSPSDLRLVAAQLVTVVNADAAISAEVPKSQEDTAESLRSIGDQLKKINKMAILQIDQFEALLTRPAVFQATLDIILACTSWSLPILWVMARKNDLAATYDEGAAIDLSQLNELSHPSSLDDFSPHDERAMIARLGEEIKAPVSKDLTEAVLTFSAGFPWLLKRVCAHVISMHQQGVTQVELSRGGLRAEDLFNEDLAGLEEVDKALLRTLAAHMPNTASELSRRLEGEVAIPRLTQKLNDFLGRKLLRLSGDVYDTYNDVFKAYLLTRRIPFQTRFVLRVTPGPALKLLTQIFDDGPTDVATFASRIGGNRTATHNKLRDLRLLGLLDPQSGRVAVSPEAATAIENDTLGDFLRGTLRSNALVAKVLDLVANSGSANLSDVGVLLKHELSHIKASESTWNHYSMIMANWVRYAGMADLEGDRIIHRDSPSDELLMRRDFQLGNFSAGTFIPSVRPYRVRELVEMCLGAPMARDEARRSFPKNQAPGVIRDAATLGLVAEYDNRIEITAQGRALATRSSKIEDKDIAITALSKVNVAALLDEIKKGPIGFAGQRAVLDRFGNANWTDRTWKWRLGILSAWVVASGQAKSGKKGLREPSDG
ncbi:nSTAND1 domain-containing NTPase [Streptomyces niveus]